MEDSKITQVQLYPIALGMERSRSQKGVPYLVHDSDVLEYLQELCIPYGTSIRIEDHIGYIDL
ncbi:hypothetical protein D3C75_945540 [compost metagenome]